MSTVLNTTGHPIDLSDGRTLAPGESAEDIDTGLSHNRVLVVNGHLLVTEGMTPRTTTPERVVRDAQKEVAR
jgi:hypothetical protein